MFKHPYSYKNAFGDSTETMMTKIAINFGIFKQQGKKWLDNAKLNQPFVKKWVSELYRKSKGPAVIVAAGPSFHNRINEVYETYPDATYFIMDRICDASKFYGVPMDYVVCSDSNPVLAKFIYGIPEETKLLLSVKCDQVVYQHAIEKKCNIYWYGPCNPFSPTGHQFKDLFGEECETTLEGCLVTFEAVDMAIQMGYNEIIVVGNDMRYYNLQDALSAGNGEAITLSDGTYTMETFQTASICFDDFKRLYPNVEFIDYSSHRLVNGELSASVLPSSTWIKR